MALDLDTILGSLNVAESVKEDELLRIAGNVLDEMDSDRASKQEWERIAEKAIELSKMEQKPKDHPWRNASNVKMPIIARAAIQFSANATSEIVRKDRVAEAVVLGRDFEGNKASRARRIAEYLNYQVLHKDNSWRDALERSVQLLSVIGTVFKKVYYDPRKKKVCSEVCLHDEIVVHNDIDCLEEARRISHIQTLHTNTLIENIRLGYFSDMTDEELHIGSDDPDMKLHQVIEQHRYLDLDGDGYEEPYIVTVHEESRKVLRIYPRFDADDIEYNDKDQISYIEPKHHFVDYHCIPSMDGGYYSVGFGALLHTLNETINTGINQLIDAGTLANTQSGFISRGMNIRGGEFKLRPGYWHKVDSVETDVRKNVQQISFKEPSTVLFQLMGLLDQSAKELSTTTDIMTGNQLAQNAPATSVLALVERGMKVYNSIQKRLFRAVTKELRLMYRLTREFGDPNEYYTVLDDPEANFQEDFFEPNIDIKPVADPDMSSDAQRLAQAQLLMQVLREPGVNTQEILKRYLEAANIANPEQILPPETNQPTDQQIKMQQDAQIEQQKLAIEAQKVRLKEMEVQLKAQKQQSDDISKRTKEYQEETRQDIEKARIQADLMKSARKENTVLEKEAIKSSTDLAKERMRQDKS